MPHSRSGTVLSDGCACDGDSRNSSLCSHKSAARRHTPSRMDYVYGKHVGSGLAVTADERASIWATA